MPNPLPLTPRAPSTAPVALAADILSEFGATCCPSISAFVERLIDRQVAGNGGARP